MLKGNYHNTLPTENGFGYFVQRTSHKLVTNGGDLKSN